MNEANGGSCRHPAAYATRARSHLPGLRPGFLHSTGQAYRAARTPGLLQLTCDDRMNYPCPDRNNTFGIVKAAQARGDFQVLAERGRGAASPSGSDLILG